MIRATWPAVLSVAIALTVLPAHAQLGEVEFAQELVRARYFEGLPYSRARQLTPAGVKVLIEMLADPGELEHRANIVMALGMSGAAQAYPALAELHAVLLEGEIDNAQYRARSALPLAMGHLARSDSRALAFLIEAVRQEAPLSEPDWSYRHLSGQRLEGVLRRATITGLAISARPEAVALLQELDERARVDPASAEESRTHIREARKLYDRIIRESPDRIFGASPSCIFMLRTTPHEVSVSQCLCVSQCGLCCFRISAD